MIAIQVARIVACFVLYLDQPIDDGIKEDDAVEMMEYLGSLLDGFEKSFLRELVDAFPIVAGGYEGDAAVMVRDIPYAFYLEETLAEGDPVRLAELEALRDARP